MYTSKDQAPRRGPSPKPQGGPTPPPAQPRCTGVERKLAKEGPGPSLSEGQKPDHACIVQERRESSHGRVKSRVPSKAEGAVMLRLYRGGEGAHMPELRPRSNQRSRVWASFHYTQFLTFCNERKLKGGSHARAEARRPTRPKGPSMLALYRSEEKAGIEGLSPEHLVIRTETTTNWILIGITP